MRSWIGDLHPPGSAPAGPTGADTIFANGFDPDVVPPTGPDLSQEHMALISDLLPTFTFNFIVRGNGTKQNGQPVQFGSTKR